MPHVLLYNTHIIVVNIITINCAEPFENELKSSWLLTPKYFTDIVRIRTFSYIIPEELWNLGNLTLIQCSFCSYANFTSCPNNDFHRTLSFYPGYSLGSCIVFSCHNVFALFSWRQFLSLSLSFMTLIFFKSTGHLFYRMFFNFEWSDFFFSHD